MNSKLTHSPCHISITPIVIAASDNHPHPHHRQITQRSQVCLLIYLPSPTPPDLI
ncbi:hypothetical protein BT96DRAFT_913615 [Gymnopus androsaceus JB14]|uniref:Uncharacterized protein n=1 Tax=Gymnopus androsaceus JB14 TaxID=1447944 RepID=A0A6A4IK65_9AGAR|nr:hypothetical protein BT96DRAFT_913615 [Gymnopus androsaceus JB14]